MEGSAHTQLTPKSGEETFRGTTAPDPLTPIQWLICAVACLGFAFDLYESLMLPLIVRPALTALGNLRPGTAGFNFWVGLLFWQSGSAGVSLMRANFEQLRGALIDGSYITEQEFDHDVAQLDDPDFVVPSPIMWTAWGRRPSA